jgi:hypothetical protein
LTPYFEVVNVKHVDLKYNLKKDYKKRWNLYRMEVPQTGKGLMVEEMFDAHSYLSMSIKISGSSKDMTKTIVVNLKDYVSLVKKKQEGMRTYVYFLCKHGVSPYDAYSALYNVSRAVALRYPSYRVEVLMEEAGEGQLQIMGNCSECGGLVLKDLFDNYPFGSKCVEHWLE